MTKTEFFCLVAGDMIGPKDMRDMDRCGFGLVLSRCRLAKGRVQVTVQWCVSQDTHAHSINSTIKYNSKDYGWGSFSMLQVLQRNVIEKA